MHFGNKLKLLRKSMNLTQSKLSELSGIPRGTLSQYELNLFEPSLSNLKSLCNVFNISLDQLCDISPPDNTGQLLNILSKNNTIQNNFKNPILLKSKATFKDKNINKNSILLIDDTTNIEFGNLVYIVIENVFLLYYIYPYDSKFLLINNSLNPQKYEFSKSDLEKHLIGIVKKVINDI